MVAHKALDDLLPIRTILVDGVELPFVRDIDFNSEAFTISVDTTEGILSITSSGIVAKDASSFGTGKEVESHLFRVLTPDAVQHIPTVNANDGAYLMASGEALYDFVITVTGKDRATAGGYRQDHRVSYTRHANGSPAIFGSLVNGTAVATGSLAGASSDVDATSGDLLRVKTTGAAATNVDWIITMQVTITKQPS